MRKAALGVLGSALVGLTFATGAGARDGAPAKGKPAEARKPLAIQLPANSSEYFPILSPPASVTMRSGLVTLAPGKSVGKHSTEDFEEMVIPLEGEGEMDITGKGKTRFRQGQTLYAPPGTEHDVTNTGKSILRYIYVVAKAPKN